MAQKLTGERAESTRATEQTRQTLLDIHDGLMALAQRLLDYREKVGVCNLSETDWQATLAVNSSLLDAGATIIKACGVKPRQ